MKNAISKLSASTEKEAFTTCPRIKRWFVHGVDIAGAGIVNLNIQKTMAGSVIHLDAI